MTGVAFITGGQRGIGLAVAHALSGAGYDVAISSELPIDNIEVVAALQGFSSCSGKIGYYRHDLSQAGGIELMLDRVENDLGPLTTFVSNAGVPANVRGDMLDISVEAFDHVMDINLKGGFFLAQNISRRMLEQSGNDYQSMIFITSVSAEMVSIERAEYCLSKAAASMMVKLYAARLAAADIGVFEIRPGIIETNMTAGVKDTYTGKIENGLVPAQRWGQVGDIGLVVLPLVTGKFAFATGSVIPVDGGLSIHRL